MNSTKHQYRWPHRHAFAWRAFTLVELLVVIAIISVLLAVLLPVLARARRKALVLASPIAYAGSDGDLHLASPSGIDMRMLRMAREDGSMRGEFVAWSPDGLKLAHSLGGKLSILEPLSGERRVIEYIAWRRVVSWGAFRCWADSNHVVLEHLGELLIVNINVNSGIITATYPVPHVMRRSFRWVSPLPPNVRKGRYVINFGNQERNSTMVALLRKDFTICKVIWEEPAIPAPYAGGFFHINASMVKADPLGEWVAWTHWREPYGVAIKRLADPATVQPDVIAQPWDLTGRRYIQFHDWTEDGNLLVAVGTDPPSNPTPGLWQLTIIDKQGRMVRKLWDHTNLFPAGHASWRKYGHW